MAHTVQQLVQDRLDLLSQSERRVARALLADYPRAGIVSASALAQASAVSAPTVVRFANQLGFTGYSDLREALRDEVSAASRGPLARQNWETSRPGGSQLRDAARLLTNAAEQTIAAIHEAEWTQAVDSLCPPTKRVLCIGGRYTGALAQALAIPLSGVRSDVHALHDPLGTDAEFLVDIGARDLLVAIDIPRYQRSTIDMVAHARKQGARTLLITDERLSPAAADASVVLPVSIASPSPFAGLTAATVVIELLIHSTVERLGEQARSRLRTWEEFRRPELVGEG